MTGTNNPPKTLAALFAVAALCAGFSLSAQPVFAAESAKPERSALSARVQKDLDIAFVEATRIGNLALAEKLLDEGADIHAREDWPLMVAVRSANKDVVALLLEYGADPSARDGEILKAAEGMPEIEALLKKRIAEIQKEKQAAPGFSGPDFPRSMP